MLSGVYVSLRFIHFISLIVAFGCVLYGTWWAPVTLRRLMMQRFYPLMRHLLLASALSALLMLMAQGGGGYAAERSAAVRSDTGSGA